MSSPRSRRCRRPATSSAVPSRSPWAAGRCRARTPHPAAGSLGVHLRPVVAEQLLAPDRRAGSRPGRTRPRPAGRPGRPASSRPARDGGEGPGVDRQPGLVVLAGHERPDRRPRPAAGSGRSRSVRARRSCSRVRTGPARLQRRPGRRRCAPCAHSRSRRRRSSASGGQQVGGDRRVGGDQLGRRRSRRPAGRSRS